MATLERRVGRLERLNGMGRKPGRCVLLIGDEPLPPGVDEDADDVLVVRIVGVEPGER